MNFVAKFVINNEKKKDKNMMSHNLAFRICSMHNKDQQKIIYLPVCTGAWLMRWKL